MNAEINELFETFEALADREEYYMQILEGKSDLTWKDQAKAFLPEVRDSLRRVTKKLEAHGYEAMDIWNWYKGE